ncbi:caspase family protein [uncultured Aquimarina sp.]|uniref:caspase family protein n=1 Tax=uncultured Aquimarina sp. TaxID=575652 RepID=UPI0026127EDF|nr:caspase family protein [uncultured Aquimarina sp.]
MSNKAILFGIENEESNITRLKGCHNDVKAWREVLEKVGSNFEIEPIYFKAEPDYFRIVIKSFIDNLELGDLGVIVFSGHGFNLEDTRSTQDRRYQGLFFSKKNREQLNDGKLKDYEILIWLKELLNNEARLIIILDCCHAFGMDRSYKRNLIEFVEPVRAFFEFLKQKLLGIRTKSLRIKSESFQNIYSSHFNDDVFLENIRDFSNVTLLSAVETKKRKAFEAKFEEGVYGYFSYCAKKICDDNSNITYSELEEKINILLSNKNKFKKEQRVSFIIGEDFDNKKIFK